MLQDHFPDRFGVVLLVNLSRRGEFLIGLIKPWLTKEVREKIHTVHVDQLSHVIEPESIPQWLGGPDTYQFDVDSYYPKRIRFSEQEARAFLNLQAPHHPGK